MSSIIKTKDITDKKEWEGFLSKHPEANFLQSWYWGEFYSNLGNKIQRTGFYIQESHTYSSSDPSADGESRSLSSRLARTIIKHVAPRLVGVMLSVVENAKRARYLIVPGGPIIDWKNTELVNAFVLEIKKIAIANDCVFARVRPQLESSQVAKNIFKQNGFINAPMHLHAQLTSQLDITQAEETLLSQMRKTTRYEIRKAISQGIKITSSKDPIAIKKFYELQIETAKRQKFVPFSYEFLNVQFKTLSRGNHALLYEAWLGKSLLAQAIIIFYNREAVYHYGASTDEGRKYPGAYLIQWKAILEAKKQGMTRYNFWGVSLIDKPNHRFYGLSLFKRGFGGQDVEYLKAQDIVINYPRYIINYVVERIRKTIRNV